MAAQKWGVIDSNITHGAVETITAYESKTEAMREAWSSWNYLTDREQEQRDYFGVALCDMVWDEYEEAMVPDPSAGYTDSIDFTGEATVRKVITLQGYSGDQKCFESTYCNEITEIPAVELVPGAETAEYQTSSVKISSSARRNLSGISRSRILPNIINIFKWYSTVL